MTTPWIATSVDSAVGAGGVAAAAAAHSSWLLILAAVLIVVRLVVPTLCRMAERYQFGKYSAAQRRDMIELERASHPDQGPS